MTAKRGRKKGSKNYHSGEPRNYAFWYWTLRNREVTNAFLERGSVQQKESIKQIVSYAKRYNPDFYERINGKEILEKLNA